MDKLAVLKTFTEICIGVVSGIMVCLLICAIAQGNGPDIIMSIFAIAYCLGVAHIINRT